MRTVASTFFFFFFFNDTATTEIYTLSLHDALPISLRSWWMRLLWLASRLFTCSRRGCVFCHCVSAMALVARPLRDRKSTRLNSSHSQISYAVFCLKKKTTRHGTLPLAPTHISYTVV